MREIKFRGKRVDTGKWIEGDLIHGVSHKSGKIYILREAFDNNSPIQGGIMHMGHGLDPLNAYEVIPETVCQYTEVDDKNGKNAYDGDIVKVNQRTVGSGDKTKYKDFYAPIQFYKGQFIISWNINYGKYRFRQGGIENTEIVGNVFDNPELLIK